MYRTPDICRYCQTPLTDANWSKALQRDHRAKVCQAHVKRFYREKNAVSIAAQRRHYREVRRPVYEALRAEMLAAYGARCACCGETIPEFLTIDHIAGGGNKHRRSLPGGGWRLYEFLKSRGWPKEGFRVLCMNCNWGRRNTGMCPHERRLRVVK